MKLLYKITETFNRAKSAIKRYPIVMILITLAAISFIIAVIKDQPLIDKVADKDLSEIRFGYFFTLASVVILFLNLFFEGLSQSAKTQENLSRNRLIKIIISIVVILGLISIAQSVLFRDRILFSYENGYIYFGLLLTSIIGCFFAAKIFYHSDYIAYNIKIFTSAIISVGYSVVIVGGLFAIYFAIDRLFSINIGYKTYISTLIIIMMVFNSGIFLSNFPRVGASFDNYQLTRPIKILITYILIPIFVIYSLVMYLYFGKILISFELPKGVIVNLILWFSLFEVALIFFAGKIDDSIIVDKFKKYFPMIMIPLLGMMFYAVGLRISEYGITENRFFVIAAGIFSFCANLYYIFYRKNSNIAIPIILALIILISSIGPLSAYNISATSQNARMERLLEKNNMLVNRHIVAKSDISENDKSEMVQIVDYMTENHRPWEFRYVPNDFKNTDEEFEAIFGFSPLYSSKNTQSIYYYYENNSSIDLMGYSRLMEFEFYSGENENKVIGNYKVSYTDGKVKVEYKKGEKYNDVVSFSMEDVLNKLQVLKNANQTVVLEDLSIKGTSNDIIYKVIFTEVNGDKLSDGFEMGYVKFYLITGSI